MAGSDMPGVRSSLEVPASSATKARPNAQPGVSPSLVRSNQMGLVA